MATGAELGRGKLWYVDDDGLQPLADALLPREAHLLALDFAPDGGSLLIGTFQGNWTCELDRDRPASQESGPPGWAAFLAPVEGHQLRLLHVPTRLSVGIFDAEGRQVGSGHVSPQSSKRFFTVSADRHRVAIPLQDGSTSVIDRTGATVATLAGQTGLAKAVHFVGGSDELVSVGREGSIRWWDVGDDELVGRPGGTRR